MRQFIAHLNRLIEINGELRLLMEEDLLDRKSCNGRKIRTQTEKFISALREVELPGDSASNWIWRHHSSALDYDMKQIRKFWVMGDLRSKGWAHEFSILVSNRLSGLIDGVRIAWSPTASEKIKTIAEKILTVNHETDTLETDSEDSASA